MLGTDDESCRCFWSGDELIHPREKCGLVRLISFYDPFTDRYYPCNCMPHRNTELAFDNSEKEAEWYYENGSRYCTGCEPLNAYCADFPESMEEDIFNY